ncbi:hypothetical protein T265_05804 [Opisthorchis viverrini]|uniref:Rho-GAP domain-containing protein n=1 Tax=Opisthorchis viverrini TaxID=6198 RepID=A0A074ZUQ8_OPIVI|nr:hypothetical protein T265_05804 [Opisthorchis viverrini]KER27115.1 hypothetical protein T265_05804 [Opisthorchis viverrini]
MERLIRKINTSPKARQKYASEGSKQFGVPLKFLVNSATGEFVPGIVCNICECILMERLIRKINTSPKARQKYASEGSKQFGVPLKFLVNSATGEFVPGIVCNICECILQNGLSLQGIFRVNGGVRLIETLRRSLERSGGCSLNVTEATELYALAGVLKLFLREIPDGLIPKEHTMQFVHTSNPDLAYASDDIVSSPFMGTYTTAQVVTESEKNGSVDTIKLEALVQQLPEENAHLLHYLCRFLDTMSRNECENKMSAQSLGILFGPCVFRFDFSSQGLRFQSSVNQVMAVLIQYHADIFRRFSAPAEPRVTCPRSELRKIAFVSSSDDEAPSSLRTNSLSITDSAEKNFFSTLFSDRSGNRYTAERLELLPSIESALLDLPSYVSLSPHPTLLRTSFSKSDCMNCSHHESVSCVPSCPPSDLVSVSAECEQSDTDTDLDAMQPQPVDPLTTVDFVLQTARDSCVADPIIQPPDYKTDFLASSASIPYGPDPKVELKSFVFCLFFSPIIQPPDYKTDFLASSASIPYGPDPKVELKSYRCAAEMNFPILSYIPKRASFDVYSPADFYANPRPNKPMIDPHLVDNRELDIPQISRVVCRTFSLPFQKSHKQSYQPHHHTFPHGSKLPLSDLLHERLECADRMLYSAALPETEMPPSFTADHNDNTSFPLTSLEKRSKSVCRSTDDAFDPLKNATCLPVDDFSYSISQRLRLPTSAMRCSKSLENIRYTAPYVNYSKDRGCSAPQPTEGRQSPLFSFLLRRKIPLSIPLPSTEQTTEDFGYRNISSVSEKYTDKPTDPTMNVEEERIVSASTTNFMSLSSLQSFQELFTAVLAEQRRRCGRPELLSLLTAEQVCFFRTLYIQQEKIDLQKGLLYFEQLHGRPQNPESKRIMRPFYERYRQVKRLLRAIEKENVMKENVSSDPDGNIHDSVDNIPKLDFVQRDTSIPDHMDPAAVHVQCDSALDNLCSVVSIHCDTSPMLHLPEHEFNPGETNNPTRLSAENACDFRLEPPSGSFYQRSIVNSFVSVAEGDLQAENERLIKRKHELQRELRAFEKSVSSVTGRPPTKAERAPMREKYHEYRSLKQNLQLLSERLHPTPLG